MEICLVQKILEESEFFLLLGKRYRPGACRHFLVWVVRQDQVFAVSELLSEKT